MSEAASQHHDRLREYYEDTWFDYRFLWLDPRTRALHFGYEAEPWLHRWPWQRRNHDDALLALNDVMADLAAVSPGQRVIDAGCGVGGSSMWLAESRGVSVVGVNVVADHVERARRYAAERALSDRVSFEVADYTATGLPDASFDVAWLVESACHAPSKAALTTEMARVVAPGGRLVMAEYVLQPDPHPSSDHVHVWNESWEMTLATADQWRQALTDGGWIDVQVLDVTSHMHRSLRRLRRLCRVLSPIAKVLKLVRIRTAAQQRNIRGSVALWDSLQAGDWRYCLITATRG
jgi:tocopherol O-methyltransferase